MQLQSKHAWISYNMLKKGVLS